MRTVLKFLLCNFIAFGFVSGAYGLTIPASEDTVGYLNKLTTGANAAPNLMVDATHTAFLYFNLNEVPQDAVLRWAKLRLFLPSVRVKGAGLGVHVVTGAWDEALASNQPVVATGTVATIGPEKLGTRRFVTVDVTSTVQSWISGGTVNEGFAIKPVSGGTAASSLYLTSKDGASLGLPAELDLDFQGSAAASGNTILNGTIAPSNSVGNGGDLYLNTASGELFGPKTTNGWPTSKSLVGPKGDTGAAGNSVLVDFGSLSANLKSALTPLLPVPPAVVSPGTLGISAQGVGALSYQWLKDGVEIVGGTGATYAMGTDDSGVYSVRVKNVLAETFSDAVQVQGGTLVGTGAVSILAQPQGAQVLFGTVAAPNVALSVNARSPLPISYQWKRNGVDIAGATTGTYTAVETGTYSVVASNAVSSV